MDENARLINAAALSAIEKRRRAKLNSMLELVIEDLIALDGVRSVRSRLLGYARHLREFHT